MATIRGAAGNVRLRGTPAPDRLDGLAVNDQIFGGDYSYGLEIEGDFTADDVLFV